MENIVTFATAQRLKDAGFPQPKPESGQYWYHPHGQLYWIQSVEGEFCTVHAPNVSRQSGWIVDTEGWIFAPTATDILREMPEHDLTFWHPQQTYYVEDTRNGIQWTNNNPAEAAALAYLKLNEKDNLKQPDYWFDEL